MTVGQLVIAGEPASSLRPVARHFEIIRKAGRRNVVIGLADGSEVTLHRSRVAIFVVPPPNWSELFSIREVSVKLRRKEETQ